MAAEEVQSTFQLCQFPVDPICQFGRRFFYQMIKYDSDEPVYRDCSQKHNDKIPSVTYAVVVQVQEQPRRERHHNRKMSQNQCERILSGFDQETIRENFLQPDRITAGYQYQKCTYPVNRKHGKLAEPHFRKITNDASPTNKRAFSQPGRTIFFLFSATTTSAAIIPPRNAV